MLAVDRGGAVGVDHPGQGAALEHVGHAEAVALAIGQPGPVPREQVASRRVGVQGIEDLLVERVDLLVAVEDLLLGATLLLQRRAVARRPRARHRGEGLVDDRRGELGGVTVGRERLGRARERNRGAGREDRGERREPVGHFRLRI